MFTQAAGLLAALAALGWGLWQLSNFCGAPLFLIGLPILRVVVPRFVWPLVRRESWLLAPNSLEVRQSFLRWRWSRSYLGASLSLERGRLGKSPTSLWVTERGRRRKLAEGPEERDLTALGTFVAARTGWPLTGL